MENMNDITVSQAIAHFKQDLPDFHSFADPGSTLNHMELRYKLDLQKRFKRLGTSLVDGSNPHFFEELYKLLASTKLDGIEGSQNLVGWRDYGALHDVINESTENRDTFTDLTRQLLISADREDQVWTNFDKLVEWINATGMKANQTKVWPSFLLSMWIPEEYIYIKPRFFDKILPTYGFQKLGHGQRMNSEQYRRVLRDMAELKKKLAELGVRDYIDVQTFLWHVAHIVLAEDSLVNIWLLRVDPVLLSKGHRLTIELQLGENEDYATIEDSLKENDKVLLVDVGSNNRILGEAHLDRFNLRENLLELTLHIESSTAKMLSIDMEPITFGPGLLPKNEVESVQTLEFCREYLDAVRDSYLLTWNPEIGKHLSTDISGTT